MTSSDRAWANLVLLSVSSSGGSVVWRDASDLEPQSCLAAWIWLCEATAVFMEPGWRLAWLHSHTHTHTHTHSLSLSLGFHSQTARHEHSLHPSSFFRGSPYRRPGDWSSDTIYRCGEDVFVCVCVWATEKEIEVLAADLKRVRASDMAVASAVMLRKLQRNPTRHHGRSSLQPYRNTAPIFTNAAETCAYRVMTSCCKCVSFSGTQKHFGFELCQHEL